MITVYENSRSLVKFHNDDVKFAHPYIECDKKFINDTFGDKYIGEVFDDNTIFLKFYSGNYILHYEDKFGNIVEDTLPMVHLICDNTVTEENSFNNDFGANF